MVSFLLLLKIWAGRTKIPAEFWLVGKREW